jgi:hypothetical protein
MAQQKEGLHLFAGYRDGLLGGMRVDCTHS